MSRFPTIPEFANTPQEMGTALRSIKQAIEQIAGLRQGESLGAPQMFVQATQPSAAFANTLKAGDLWINTTNDTLRYWNGSQWKPVTL